MLLITGITGHSGKYFLEELIKNNYKKPIRCIVRESSDTTFLDNCGLNIDKLVGDLDDQTFLNKAFQGVETVFHIASIFYSVKIMNAAIENNVNKSILVHTTGIYSNYKSASEEYKEIENKVTQLLTDKKSQMGLIYLRPTMIYGYENDRNMIVFIKMVDKLRLFPVINGGNNKLQPVNGRDLGKAYYQILNKNDIMYGDYVLSGERPVTMKELFKLISLLLDKKTIFMSVPLSIGVFLAKLLKIVTFSRIDFIERVQRMGEDRNFPHEKAVRDFGYSPMPLVEGLKQEIEEYLHKNK